MRDWLPLLVYDEESRQVGGSQAGEAGGGGGCGDVWGGGETAGVNSSDEEAINPP